MRCFRYKKYGHYRERAAVDFQYVDDVAKKTKTTWMEIVPRKSNAQTPKRIIIKNLQYIQRREREIMEVKYRRNITFLKAGKIVETYMEDNNYANVAKKVSSISNNDNQSYQYRVVIKKQVQLGQLTNQTFKSS